MQRILKALALAVAVSFLAGAVLTAARTSAAGTARDAGTPAPDAGSSAAFVLDEDSYLSGSKSGPLPRPRHPDGGTRTFLPATKSPGGMALPREQQAP